MTSIERLDDPHPGNASGGLSADLAAAAARLHAWHAVADGPPPEGRAADEAAPDQPAPGERNSDERDPDELVDRLRARRSAARSARHVAAAYAATHGHPLDGDDDGAGRRRWGLGLRTAVVASVVVLVIALGAAVVAFLQPDDVVTLAGAETGAEAPAVEPAGGAAPAGDTEPAESTEATETDEPAEPAETDGPQAVVHVVGEVREPGLVTVAADARVADAVEAAGGPTRGADTAAVNLARAVVDGEQIVVPAPGEAPPAGGADGADGGGSDPGAEGSVPGTGEVLDLNAAAASDLEVLPGIGPVLAERVIAWRDDNGPFTSVDELEEVSGIGPSVMEQLRDLVRV